MVALVPRVTDRRRALAHPHLAEEPSLATVAAAKTRAQSELVAETPGVLVSELNTSSISQPVDWNMADSSDGADQYVSVATAVAPTASTETRVEALPSEVVPRNSGALKTRQVSCAVMVELITGAIVEPTDTTISEEDPTTGKLAMQRSTGAPPPTVTSHAPQVTLSWASKSTMSRVAVSPVGTLTEMVKVPGVSLGIRKVNSVPVVSENTRVGVTNAVPTVTSRTAADEIAGRSAMRTVMSVPTGARAGATSTIDADGMWYSTETATERDVPLAVMV
mmetsp:Transcript_14170/g.33071  ORF Transcript_14170/g.33071 Transcript_14170/m.33071 type:complete len:278 (+) Transcript_14170:1873-2706(+)